MDQSNGPKEDDVIVVVAMVEEGATDRAASDGSTTSSVGWSRSYANNYDSIFGKKNSDLN